MNPWSKIWSYFVREDTSANTHTPCTASISRSNFGNAERWKSHHHPLLNSASCSQCVFVHHLSVFVTHPRDSEQQRCVMEQRSPTSRGVRRSLCDRPKQELVAAWSLLSASNDRFNHWAYTVCSQMMRETVKKWDATCICSVVVHR